MNQRTFFKKLASGLVVAAAPSLFLPKLIQPAWKAPTVPPIDPRKYYGTWRFVGGDFSGVEVPGGGATLCSFLYVYRSGKWVVGRELTDVNEIELYVNPMV